jgi:hypothetical protein
VQHLHFAQSIADQNTQMNMNLLSEFKEKISFVLTTREMGSRLCNNKFTVLSLLCLALYYHCSFIEKASDHFAVKANL